VRGLCTLHSRGWLHSGAAWQYACALVAPHSTASASKQATADAALLFKLQGMAVKYLGSNCQSDICEQGCHGKHQFYKARILPPRAVPEPGSLAGAGGADLAASLAQAQTAITGRPVLLILDLHSRLRSRSLEDMLRLPTAEELQVAPVCGCMPGLDTSLTLTLQPLSLLPAQQLTRCRTPSILSSGRRVQC
jgi:hypothetical protein